MQPKSKVALKETHYFDVDDNMVRLKSSRAVDITRLSEAQHSQVCSLRKLARSVVMLIWSDWHVLGLNSTGYRVP